MQIENQILPDGINVAIGQCADREHDFLEEDEQVQAPEALADDCEPFNLADLNISTVEVPDFDCADFFKQRLHDKYGQELVERAMELAKTYDIYLEDH